MAGFTWLHLSDFHLRNPLEYSREMLFQLLLDDISKQCADGLKPDAVFFTGDIAFSGGGTQYQVAIEKFDELLEACGLTGQKDRLFVVPGNHDVERKRVTSPCSFFGERVLERVEDHYEQLEKALSDEEFRRQLFSRFYNYENFLTSYFGDSLKDKFNSDQLSYYYATCIPLEDGKKIGVIGLNSAWMSEKDNEQGRLFLTRQQVYNALKEIENRCPDACLRIALMHHPLYWLAEEDMALVEPLLAKSRSILLHGHLHCARMGIHSNPDSLIHILAAGASFESRAKLNAYNIVQLDFDEGRAVAILRFQHPTYSPNWNYDNLTYLNAENGKLIFEVEVT